MNERFHFWRGLTSGLLIGVATGLFASYFTGINSADTAKTIQKSLENEQKAA